MVINAKNGRTNRHGDLLNNLNKWKKLQVLTQFGCFSQSYFPHLWYEMNLRTLYHPQLLQKFFYGSNLNNSAPNHHCKLANGTLIIHSVPQSPSLSSVKSLKHIENPHSKYVNCTWLNHCAPISLRKLVNGTQLDHCAPPLLPLKTCQWYPIRSLCPPISLWKLVNGSRFRVNEPLCYQFPD